MSQQTQSNLKVLRKAMNSLNLKWVPITADIVRIQSDERTGLLYHDSATNIVTLKANGRNFVIPTTSPEQMGAEIAQKLM